MPNNIIMADAKGETMNYNEQTGAYYPTILDITIAGGRGSGQTIKNGVLGKRWQYCSELKEATIDSPNIALSTKGASEFSNCPKLEKITILGGVSYANASILAEDCPQLKTVILGSIGYPCDANLSGTLFRNSGGSVVGEKSITIYVTDETPIPLGNEPFGLTGATVIYRSSTTGEVRTE